MPSSSFHSFADPQPYQAAIRAAEVEVLVTAKGEFHAELTKIDLHRLWLQRGRESLPRVFHSSVSAKRAPIVFLASADQAAIQHSGMDVSPSELIVDGLGSTHHIRSWGPSHWGAMSLTPEDLAAAGYALAGRELTVPSVTHLVRPSAPLMSRLLNLHENAERLAKTTPDVLARPEVARALEQALVDAMVRCLTESTPVETGAGSHHHSRVIGRFEDLLAANAGKPMYLAEICAAIGVSERTLRVCCQQHLGMGPVRYLWLRRMHFARRALFLGAPETSTVTDIATEFGFWELGRFSVEYRALFGESPSASLRRPPDDPRISEGRLLAFADSEFA
jgi:AraC-like DNA-binding protein